MIDPYRMVLVNLLASVFLISGLLLYKKFFQKKKINLFVLLILISILPVISIFRVGVYESGDFIFHIYHAIDFSNALRDGILIPSWAAGLNSGYGHPVFIFIYSVPYYLISLFHFLGFTYIFSERIVLASIFIGSGVTMWLLLKKLTRNDLAAFTGSILYLFAPYHLLDLHFRVAIAESTVFLITPLMLYFILRAKEELKLVYLVWLSLLFGILFLTHPAMFVIYSGLFFLYALFLILTKRTSFKFFAFYLGSFCIGMMIASFAWLPRIYLTPLTQGSILLNSPIHFVTPRELLFSTWRGGFLFQGPMGELSYVIGYAGILMLIISIFILLREKGAANYKDILFWTFIFISTIFIMLPVSKIVWETFTFLNLMQFAYRFLHVLAFCTAILAAYITIIYAKKKTLIFLFLFLSIGYTILNWGNRGTIPEIDDKWIINNLPNGTKEGERMIEAIPLWWDVEEDFLSVPKQKIEVIEGDARIQEFKRTTTLHIYGVYANNPTTLVENTLYFPDWKVKVNGKEVPIDYKHPEYNARMVFNVPTGLNHVEVSYSDIKQIKSAKKISLTVFFILICYLILHYILRLFRIISPAKKDREE